MLSFPAGGGKYLKAFIVANGLEFRAIHNLLELLQICKQHNPGLEELRQDCRFLNPFYIDTRYPVHWPAHYDKDAAVKAKKMATNVRNWIKETLNI